jgi:hypothetical protein
MIKFVTCLISWILIPLAMVVVAWDVAKCWVEDALKKAIEK